MSACDRCLAASAIVPRLQRVPTGDEAALAQATRLASGLRQHAQRSGVEACCVCDSGYPAALRQLPDPPPVLWLRGDARLLERCPGEAVGIVGTRRPTLVGRDAARRLAAGIARSDGLVVSGMALGVDGAAHDGALAVRAPTLAVLAGGADLPTPPSHRRLYERILDCGLVVAELPPGTRPTKWSFPARNRIIAALSCATVVVEAPLRSGALITVGHALALGRDVYAVPGSVASDTCEGSNQLLCEGAPAVTDGAALAARLGMQRVASAGPPDGGAPALVHAALRRAPLAGAELALRVPLGPGELELALLDLELAGWVERRADGRYRAVDGAAA